MDFPGDGIDKVNFYSPRQSENWAKYLQFLNWEVIETSMGIKIALLKSFIGYLTKIQRPKVFDLSELQEIEEICSNKNAAFIKIEPGYGQDIDMLENNGYIYSNFPLSPPATLVIDLRKSYEDLWKDLSESAKYSVHRAQREGSKVTCVQNPTTEQLKEFYEISKETGERGKFYVQPIADLYKKAEVFGDESFLLDVRDKEGSIVSAKFFVGYKGMVTYLQGGTTKNGRKEKGGYDLMWKSFLYFKEKKYDFIDLEGVDDPRFPFFTKNWGGFSHFKEKFGGIRIDFPRPYIKLIHPALKFTNKFFKMSL